MILSAKPVAIISGASSGMGKDFALRLLIEGYVVYGVARRIERMDDLEDAGGIALALDVTDDLALILLVDRIVSEQGRIDVLINNAGYGEYGALEDVPIEAARRQMEVNLFSAARLTQLCLPHMRDRRAGHIINISSIGGKFALPLGGWYQASKFALEAYSDSLRNEVRSFGLKVIVIEPGGVKSEWSSIAMESAKRYSGKGAYADLADKMQKAMTGQRRQSDPNVITNLVIRALNARRPKPRYHGGFMARTMLFLKWSLSDRIFDRLLMTALK